MTHEEDGKEPWDDPIVLEVRRVREALFAASDHDLDKFIELLRREQANSDRQVVSLPSKPPVLTGGEAA